MCTIANDYAWALVNFRTTFAPLVKMLFYHELKWSHTLMSVSHTKYTQSKKESVHLERGVFILTANLVSKCANVLIT